MYFCKMVQINHFGWSIIGLCLIVITGAQQTVPTWTATFSSENLTVHMTESEQVTLSLDNVDVDSLFQTGAYFRVVADHPLILTVSKSIYAVEFTKSGQWHGNVTLEAIFLGLTNVYVELVTSDGASVLEMSPNSMPIVIIRKVRTIDSIFVGSVATLVALLYINFGAALNLSTVKAIFRRPIGPAIGFCGQFVVMPLLSFGLGYLLFPDNPEMQLGMFFTGCSPAGGASNIWTVLLEGNLDLSIAMSAISNIASFGMMPLWLFTLGKVIFDNGQIAVPYQSISTYVAALIGPLIIGLLIQRYLPRVNRILVRILKPASSLLILFIVVFAVVTNLYLFELFSWQILVAGLFLPWLSYILGFTAAWIFRQPYPDCLAIALETGIQNTGIAIFLLRFTLPQPQADLTTVVPVSVAIFTPVPLIFMYIFIKVRQCINKPTAEALQNETDSINDSDLAVSPSTNKDLEAERTRETKLEKAH